MERHSFEDRVRMNEKCDRTIYLIPFYKDNEIYGIYIGQTTCKTLESRMKQKKRIFFKYMEKSGATPGKPVQYTICKNSDYQTANQVEQEVTEEYIELTNKKCIRVSGGNYAAYNSYVINNSIMDIPNTCVANDNSKFVPDNGDVDYAFAIHSAFNHILRDKAMHKQTIPPWWTMGKEVFKNFRDDLLKEVKHQKTDKSRILAKCNSCIIENKDFFNLTYDQLKSARVSPIERTEMWIKKQLVAFAIGVKKRIGHNNRPYKEDLLKFVTKNFSYDNSVEDKWSINNFTKMVHND